MPRKYVKTTGPGMFIKAVMMGGTPDSLLEAYRKEASRQVGEMQRWMDFQIDNDPYNMLENFAEEVFPMIHKANKYRNRIYNRNRVFDGLKFDKLAAKAKNDLEALEEIALKWGKAEDEQIMLCWRIKKIHLLVKEKVQLQLDKTESHPFEDYGFSSEAEE